MKAADRCPEHNQGDRCTREKEHGGPCAGNFAVWKDGFVEQKFVRKYPRNRIAAREDKYRKSWITNVTRSICLDALRELYVKSFKKKPEEKNAETSI